MHGTREPLETYADKAKRLYELARTDEQSGIDWTREPHDYVDAYPVHHGCFRCKRIRLCRWHPKER